MAGSQGREIDEEMSHGVSSVTPMGHRMHIYLTRWIAATAAIFALSLSAQTLFEPVVPPLRTSQDSDGSLVLTWPTVEGQSYRIENNTSLSADTWSATADWQQATGEPMSFAAPRPATGDAFFRVAVAPTVRRVAILGDSISEQGSTNLIHLTARGHFDWARAFSGSTWDLVSTGASFAFATSGKRSDELTDLHLAQVMASDADVCVLAYGTNDALQLRPVEAFIATASSNWETLREAGIEPVATTVPPMGSNGGGMAARQARVAEYNVAMRQAASAHQVVLCDWSPVLEAVPGSNNGVGLDSYFLSNDNLHPRPLAASRTGRVLADTLRQNFVFARDLWQKGTWITPNPILTGNNGQPSAQWTASAPVGASILSKSLIPSAEGNWWELKIHPGTSTGIFQVMSLGANVSGGKKVECVAEVQVMSGNLDFVGLQATTGTVVASDLNLGERMGAQVLPEDGVVVLRTPAVTLGSAVAAVFPALLFNSSEAETVIRIRRCGIREVP